MTSISETRTAIDRISNLPNNLITHILSFLSTEDAVKTSALSTHWYQQWTSITHLDIDDGLLIKENSDFKRNPNPRSGTNFVNFVYSILLAEETPLELFRVKGAQDYGVTNVCHWLSVALSRNVRKIDLMVPLVGYSFRHDCLFSSSTLVMLTLGLGFLLSVPKIFSLESLKILHLNHIQFEDGESLSRLVSSCPVLEELRIEGELSKSVNVLNISSPVLKYLILVLLHSVRVSEIDGAHSYEVVLNTPSLQYFEHNDNGVPDGYHIESTLHCLDRAWLSLSLSGSQFDEYDDPIILAHSMADLAVAISNVRSLYLSESAFWALYHPEIPLPNFQLPNFLRLTNLDIGLIMVEKGLGLLIAFLQNSPQLASLSFGLEDDLDHKYWDPPTDVPFCMLYNLKVIEVIYCRDPEPGLSMIKYFLEKTNCLEKLIIPCMKENNEEYIKKVSLFPRASESCKIVQG